MSNPVVLITGALTGIGRATAFAFAKEGTRVVVSGRRDDAGEALAIELRATGAEAEFIRADVRHENDVRNLVDNTVAGSAASTLPSTTPVPKASPGR
jgi:NAD(P)-dependent dehydrogenase (short-subunit alcohol dehydrogenase family)